MINSKSVAKRGRPKRKNSDEDVSSEEFVKKKVLKKAVRVPKASKKAAESEKRGLKKTLVKSKIAFSDSSESEEENSEEVEQEIVAKVVHIPLEMFKPDKLFAEILNKANKQPDFLIMLRNLLSGCSRILRDKKNFLRKKWQQLRNSNCTQDQYLSRESQLKRMEVEQIYEIQKDIMSKLSLANIKGFQSRENIIQDCKSKLEQEGDVEYAIEEEVWVAYHQLQKKLLSQLMNQKDLVYSTSMDHPTIGKLGAMAPRESKTANEDNEMDVKFNNIETQENPQTTQFLFCKHFSEINFQKVFESSNPFKLHENDIYYMDPKALGWILQTKSDQIYTNQKFQKETFKRYTQMLQLIYSKPDEFTDDQLIQHLLQITAYVLNSVHYYQKFKLKCDLLHPLDLLLVIEKIKKERRKEALGLEQTFEKQLEGIAYALEGSHHSQ